MSGEQKNIEQPTPKPNPNLQSLERLIGTWQVSEGRSEGMAKYEWQEGSFFLVQHVDLEQYGQRVKGLEVIGHLQLFGEAPSEDIKSHFYDNMGQTLDYTHELGGDTLTIWGGEKGSPAYFKGTFSENGNVCSGEWVYPGGGADEPTMRRIE